MIKILSLIFALYGGMGGRDVDMYDGEDSFEDFTFFNIVKLVVVIFVVKYIISLFKKED